MPSKTLQTAGRGVIDYKSACRCCLKMQSDADFYELDSCMVARSLASDEKTAETDKIPLMRCLLFCIRAERIPELPQYICGGCSKSLQITYHFLQNALRAHEILCHKLCPDKAKRIPRFNGQQARLSPPQRSQTEQSPAMQQELVTEPASRPKPQPRKAVRHECKVCGAVIYDKLELKQHIRLHSDVVAHNCKLCKFVTLKQRQLLEHYRMAHGLSAAPTQQASSTSAVIDSHNNAAEQEVKICTLEDMELLIPTVLRPEDYAQPEIDAEQLREIEQQLAGSMENTQQGMEQTFTTLDANEAGDFQAGNNLSIGTEYLVMPDGSLQQINGSDVLFEYINETGGNNKNQHHHNNNNNNSSSSNVSLQNLLGTATTAAETDASVPMDIDVNELIVEELSTPLPIAIKSTLPPARGVSSLKHKCSQCPKAFATTARLKSHQLTHSNLPKFYCDECHFYSLRSCELMEHYKQHHNISPEDVHLLAKAGEPRPGDGNRNYSCDMCLYETQSCGQLRAHYNNKHGVEPTEVQLRPSWCSEAAGSRTTGGSLKQAQELQEQQQTEFPLGITYPHTNHINATTEQQQLIVAALPCSVNNTLQLNNATLLYAAPPTVNETPAGNAYTLISTTPEEARAAKTARATEAPATLEPMVGDMQDFIDNTDVAAICTIPADDMPVADGDDIIIDNNNISLDFDAETLFEDFEEEEDEEAEEEDDEGEDVEDDDENDNNDSAIDQNLLHTSDEDDVDDFDDEQSKHLQKPYCIYCNKKFTSQYKFENHMFVHRGLAPYRCELCTNLYNRKRALIRHYKAVHKRMPTRDMVQAKGEKVSVDRTNIEKLQLNADKSPALMCAKCPFECEPEAEMRRHLNAHHGINENVSCHANEVFIIRKLPYECPRCIRTFAAKQTLTRHLQRSHLVDTIIELQSAQTTTSSATTTTTSTPTTTLPSASDSVASQVAAATATADECELQRSEEEVATLEDNKLHDINTATTTAAATATTATTQLQMVTLEPSNGNDAATTSPMHATNACSNSALFSTPTPMEGFDFDYDFMGDATTANTLRIVADQDTFNNTSTSEHSQLLKDDKLLTAALEPSPVKDLRSCLPRTPFYVCKECNYTCDELCKFNVHQKQQHAIGDVSSPRRTYDFKCTICNSTYRTITLLKFHMKRHIKRNYKCDECPKTFVQRPELTKHRITHSGETPFKCEMCPKAFRYKHHMKRHFNSKHLNKRFPCLECGRQLSTSSQLGQHMKTHRGTHAYKCPAANCTRAFTRRKPLRVHALRKHQQTLTDDDLADVFRKNVGYTNPHDLRVITRSGELLRRTAVEAAAAAEQRAELADAVVNITT